MKKLLKSFLSLAAMMMAMPAMALQVVSTNPAEGSSVDPGYNNVAFYITFDQEFQMLSTTPNVSYTYVRNGQTKSFTPDECWKITKQTGSNTIQVWSMDMDGYLETLKAEDGDAYTVVFPADVIKGQDGTKNEAITIHFTCGKVAVTTAPAVSASNPAEGAEIQPSKYANMVFEFTFDQAVTRVVRTPAIVMKETQGEVTTTLDPEDSWEAAVDGSNKLRVWGADYDGYTMTYEAKAGAAYTVTIPAGVVKNADGLTNEEIVLHYTCAKPVLPAPSAVSTTPAQDESINPSKYAEMKVVITFDQDVTCAMRTPAAVMKQTLGEATTTIEPDDSWTAAVDNGKTLSVWGQDYDGYLMTYDAKAGATYAVTIPAGIVKNADGIANEEFVVTWSVKKPIAEGETYEAAPYTYKVLANNKLEITKAEKQSEYVIPATVNIEGTEYAVAVIGEYAFKYCAGTSIEIGKNVEKVGYSAFASSDFTQITFAEGSKLDTIAGYGFNSTKITSLTLPASLKYIGNSAFFTCRQLEQITFNEGLETIDPSAFYKCEKLSAITLPSTLKNLGAKAFLWCTGIKAVVVPEGVKVLPDGVFNNCTALESITLPSTLEEMGTEVFFNCPNLTEISLPASLKKMGTSVIAKSGISNIKLDEKNEFFALKDGVLYGMKTIKDEEVLDRPYYLLYAVPQKGVSEVVVADGCLGINGGAFWASQVSKVTLPTSVIAIDNYAFCQSPLSTINLSDSIIFIGEQAFAATNLIELTLPSKLNFVADGAFAGCKSLVKVTMPASIQIIYNHAFHDCSALANVYALGETAPEIDDVWETYDSPFLNVPAGAKLHIPAGATASYQKAGWNEYFTIVEDLTSISEIGMKSSANTVSYDLNGRATSKANGLQVRNGHLMFVK